MFLDNVVVAGVVTVGLMLVFFVGLGFLSGRIRASAISSAGFFWNSSTQGILGDLGRLFFCLCFLYWLVFDDGRSGQSLSRLKKEGQGQCLAPMQV